LRALPGKGAPRGYCLFLGLFLGCAQPQLQGSVWAALCSQPQPPPPPAYVLRLLRPLRAPAASLPAAAAAPACPRHRLPHISRLASKPSCPDLPPASQPPGFPRLSSNKALTSSGAAAWRLTRAAPRGPQGAARPLGVLAAAAGPRTPPGAPGRRPRLLRPVHAALRGGFGRRPVRPPRRPGPCGSKPIRIRRGFKNVRAGRGDSRGPGPGCAVRSRAWHRPLTARWRAGGGSGRRTHGARAPSPRARELGGPYFKAWWQRAAAAAAAGSVRRPAAPGRPVGRPRAA
jgi:hypothetical protein